MSTKPIVYLEKNEAWLFDGESFTPCEFSAVKKHQCGTTLPLSKLQIGSFKFSSSLSQTELQIQTEIKMHEEGGLNANLDYEVASFNHVLEFENSVLVEAFASSHEELHDSCDSIVKKTKVLDWVVPSFITYSAYYVHNEIEAKTDLFYYLGEEESYAVLFHKGKYAAHRRTLSLEDIAKEVGIDTLRCKSLLSMNGLVETNYSEQDKPFFEQLQLVFSKQVEKIVHAVNHKRGLFGIEGVDRIFIDFDGHSLEGIDAVFAAYGMEGLPIESLACKTNEHAQTHRLMQAMYIYLCANGLMENPLNLSPFERRALWHKRPSGHLIGITTAAMLAAMIYPGYFYTQGLVLEQKIQDLEVSVAQVEAKTNSLGIRLQALEEEVVTGRNKLKAVEDKNAVYTITLDTLPVLMNTRYVRQKMMSDALDILSRYKLSTLSLDQNGTKSMDIHVISDYASRESIAKFMKKWMQTGYKEARTKKIYLDENIYESKIEVLR